MSTSSVRKDVLPPPTSRSTSDGGCPAGGSRRQTRSRPRVKNVIGVGFGFQNLASARQGRFDVEHADEARASSSGQIAATGGHRCIGTSSSRRLADATLVLYLGRSVIPYGWVAAAALTGDRILGIASGAAAGGDISQTGMHEGIAPAPCSDHMRSSAHHGAAESLRRQINAEELHQKVHSELSNHNRRRKAAIACCTEQSESPERNLHLPSIGSMHAPSFSG
ncbi:hypothetical protein V8D89_005996 [Ganoderma adspersum]